MPKAFHLVLMLSAVAAGLFLFALPLALADDLDSLKVPVFRDRAGYGIAITEYQYQTDAELFDGDEPEHKLQLSSLLQPAEDEDVLCFASSLKAKHAYDSRGRDLLIPERRSKKQMKFNALIPSDKYSSRRGQPLLICESELDGVQLKRPGSEVEELVVVATALIVKKRRSEEIAAEVSRDYNDIGSGVAVRVSAMEVDEKDEMTVTLVFKHAGNRNLPVIDSVYALNDRGKRVGGGRWTNELELFGRGYEVQMEFPLQHRDVDRFEVVLATDYELEEVEFEIEDLFQD